MTKQRVVIQDLSSAAMPVITEMTDVVHVQDISGDLLRFVHGDGSGVTLINIAPGWIVTISECEEDKE